MLGIIFFDSHGSIILELGFPVVGLVLRSKLRFRICVSRRSVCRDRRFYSSSEDCVDSILMIFRLFDLVLLV